MRRLKALTLFAGAGGSDIGIANAGFDHVRCIEWWEPAYKTLKAAGFPAVFGDVRDPRLYRNLPPIDLLWASPPCQGFSSAGMSLGALDPRNGFPWTWLVVDHLKRRGLGPTWLITENVRGMTFHKGACEGGKTCTGDCRAAYLKVVLSEARARFAWAEWRILDAVDYGVPQFRKRVILVCGPRPIKNWPKPTHSEPGKAGADWETVRKALGTISAADGPVVKGTTNIELDSPSKTIIAGGAIDASGKQGGGAPPYLATGRRRLTLAECAILQDFPRDYPWQGTKTSIYKQIGNAVPAKLAEVAAHEVWVSEMVRRTSKKLKIIGIRRLRYAVDVIEFRASRD